MFIDPVSDVDGVVIADCFKNPENEKQAHDRMDCPIVE